MKVEATLDLLQEYMDIYCQLLGDVEKAYLPSFEYFLEHYNDPAYSLSIPHYRNAWKAGEYGGEWLTNEKGLGNNTCKCCGKKGYDSTYTRIEYFNYWRGKKFYVNERERGI